MSEFPRSDFSVRTEQHGAAAVVVPAGELDMATAPAVDEALEQAFASNPAHVVLDLRELEFIDTSGLRTLLIARRRADAAGAYFTLLAGDPALGRTLEIAGLHKVFDWTPASELA